MSDSIDPKCMCPDVPTFPKKITVETTMRKSNPPTKQECVFDIEGAIAKYTPLLNQYNNTRCHRLVYKLTRSIVLMAIVSAIRVYHKPIDNTRTNDTLGRLIASDICKYRCQHVIDLLTIGIGVQDLDRIIRTIVSDFIDLIMGEKNDK